MLTQVRGATAASSASTVATYCPDKIAELSQQEVFTHQMCRYVGLSHLVGLRLVQRKILVRKAADAK